MECRPNGFDVGRNPQWILQPKTRFIGYEYACMNKKIFSYVIWTEWQCKYACHK
jgi:hypothetical protein